MSLAHLIDFTARVEAKMGNNFCKKASNGQSLSEGQPKPLGVRRGDFVNLWGVVCQS